MAMSSKLTHDNFSPSYLNISAHDFTIDIAVNICLIQVQIRNANSIQQRIGILFCLSQFKLNVTCEKLGHNCIVVVLILTSHTNAIKIKDYCEFMSFQVRQHN